MTPALGRKVGAYEGRVVAIDIGIGRLQHHLAGIILAE